MVQSQYCLSWDSFKTSICDGLSALQQNGEFVDMTIAADGHFVKVHQMVMALASPYLKELITSAPCQHPVIFLNNVSHRSLCSLLEYIYTGEALVPAEALSTFIETAKALHIKGLENMSSCEMNLPVRMALHVTQLEGTNLTNTSLTGEKMEQVDFSIQNLDALKRKVARKQKIHSGTPSTTLKTLSGEEMGDYPDDPGHDSDDNQQYTSQTYHKQTSSLLPSKAKEKSIKATVPSNLQFTVSIRGSLQIILNRYMYNLHSLTSRTGIRRWRCVDYRNHKCLAFVVTNKNVVLSRVVRDALDLSEEGTLAAVTEEDNCSSHVFNYFICCESWHDTMYRCIVLHDGEDRKIEIELHLRGNLHNHPFHDKKILTKIENNAVYSALDEVEGYKDKEPTDDSSKQALDDRMEDEQYLSLSFSDNESDAIMKT